MTRHIDQVFDDFVKDPSAVHDSVVGPVGNNSKCVVADTLCARSSITPEAFEAGGICRCASASKIHTSPSILVRY